MTASLPPLGVVASADGTRIGWFREAPTADADEVAGRPPVILVHGAAADHTTWRVFGPMLAASRPVVSMDRRGRGASGDTSPHALAREFDDVAAVARLVAAATGGPVDVLGHSYGGRCTLGAAVLAPDTIRRVVSYEGAVPPRIGSTDLATLEALQAEGRSEDLLIVFLRDVVEMSAADLERYQASPVWPARVAAAPTIIREVRAGQDDQGAWAAFMVVRQPVLQVLGSESPAFFRDGAMALDEALPDSRIAIIEGAMHAAHHSHPEALLGAVRSFLDLT